MKTNTVYFKDASSMSEVEDNSISLVVTSPPYWNIKDYSLDGYQEKQISSKALGQIGDIPSFKDYLDALLLIWKECERVLRPNGKIAINTPIMPIEKKQLNTHYTRNIVDINSSIQQSILKHTKLNLFDTWIWNRTNPSKGLMFGSYPYPPNFYAQNTIEFITVYVKDGPPPKIQEAIKEKSKLTEAEWVSYTKQVWDIPIPGKSDLAYGRHPAIMPIEIPNRFIKLFTFVGDIVLDPMLGSGTTALAAQQLDRRWIGYEVNKEFESVIEAKVGQQVMF